MTATTGRNKGSRVRRQGKEGAVYEGVKGLGLGGDLVIALVISDICLVRYQIFCTSNTSADKHPKGLDHL